ncbi:unnamed protein product [Calicophoron daubneyi]|uniref:Protein kinase domain-containing protein n=1 Tax=Calicophoron daubneyi TaxID=300641 RepID=A0AAV2TZ35_CALDB
MTTVGVFQLDMPDVPNYEGDEEATDECVPVNPGAQSDSVEHGLIKQAELNEHVGTVGICGVTVNPVQPKAGPPDFYMLKVLDKRSYGEVFLARKINTGHTHTIKVPKEASIVTIAEDTARSRGEDKVLQMIEHPFLVQLYCAYQTSGKLYLVLTGGELVHAAKEGKHAHQSIVARAHYLLKSSIYRIFEDQANTFVNFYGFNQSRSLTNSPRGWNTHSTLLSKSCLYL